MSAAPKIELNAVLPMAQLPPKKLLLLLALSLVTGLSALPASAQNAVTVRGHQLEQASWPKARLQLQIVDESPELKDCRRRKEASPNFLINVGPLPSASASPGTIVLTPEPNSLQPSGFTSQIPAGGMAPSRSLPATTMGGHAPTGAAAAGPRPIMNLGHDNLVAGRKLPSSPAPVVASFKPYNSLLESHGMGAERRTSTELHAVLIQHDRTKNGSK
jgi:hypothetical protein